MKRRLNRTFSPLPTQIRQKQILGASLKKKRKTKTSNYCLGQWGKKERHKEKQVSHKPHADIRNSTQSLFQKKEPHSLILPCLKDISSYIKLYFLVNTAK